MNPWWDTYLNLASKVMLFAAGVTGTVIILWNVVRAYRQRRRIQSTLMEARAAA